MARGRSNHGNGDGVTHHSNSAINRENEYRNEVKKLQIHTVFMAETLTAGGEMEKFFMEADPDNAGAFLAEQRNRLKGIAEKNAKQMKNIDYFIQGLKNVNSSVRAAASNDGGEGQEEDAPTNYERAIQDAIEAVRQAKENSPDFVPASQHEMVIEVEERLGERARGGGDDDLEIVENFGSDDVATLKCPFTGMLFEDPVKSKVCGHVYDRRGLTQLINSGKRQCPIPGCSNNSLTWTQVESDEEMKLRVKRYKKREEAAKRKRELDESMDDQGGGYTVLE